MSEITTHVLDAVLGKPAVAISVRLEQQTATGWLSIADAATDNDGRCKELCHNASEGTYRLTFATTDYFHRNQRTSLYPEISISFNVDGIARYHIPILLSDNSFT